MKKKKVEPKKVQKTRTTSSRVNQTRVSKTRRKKRKIRFGRIFLALFILFFFFYLISRLFSFPIKNIYIKGNTILSDQEIIELAHLETYPSYFTYTKRQIESSLEKNEYIKNAKVRKKWSFEVYLEIEENKPLFYDESKEKTVLYDGTFVEKNFSIPVLLNYVPDTIYEDFLSHMAELDPDILTRISEMKYDPNEVDEKRFLFSMNDGNYVYVTLNTISKMNHYVEIMKEVLAKYKEEKGILFLDEGEYFKVFSK